MIANPAQVCAQLVERLAADQEAGAAEAMRVPSPAPPTAPSSDSAAAESDYPDSVAAAMGLPVSVARQASRKRGLHLWKGLKKGVWQQPAGGAASAPWTWQPPELSKLSIAKPSSAPGFCHPGTLLRALSGHVRAQDVVCVDTGDITLWTSLCLRLTHGTTTLSSERLGTMGYALCAGIAASLERGPDSKAVVIAGDGGFQMTMNELGTAVQHGANLLIIVVDNGVLGRVEFGFSGSQGCEITGCDWVALARCYGADGMHVTSDGEIESALSRGMASKGVFVLAAHTDPQVKADMAKTSDAQHPQWLSAPQQKVDSG